MSYDSSAKKRSTVTAQNNPTAAAWPEIANRKSEMRKAGLSSWRSAGFLEAIETEFEGAVAMAA